MGGSLILDDDDHPAARDAAAGSFVARLSRRQVLQGGVAAAITAMFGLPGCATPGAARPPALGFNSVPISSADTLVVPAGYRANVRSLSWSDCDLHPHRFSNWPDYRPDGRPRSGTVVVRRDDGGVIGS